MLNELGGSTIVRHYRQAPARHRLGRNQTKRVSFGQQKHEIGIGVKFFHVRSHPEIFHGGKIFAVGRVLARADHPKLEIAIMREDARSEIFQIRVHHLVTPGWLHHNNLFRIASYPRRNEFLRVYTVIYNAGFAGIQLSPLNRSGYTNRMAHISMHHPRLNIVHNLNHHFFSGYLCGGTDNRIIAPIELYDIDMSKNVGKIFQRDIKGKMYSPWGDSFEQTILLGIDKDVQNRKSASV